MARRPVSLCRESDQVLHAIRNVVRDCVSRTASANAISSHANRQAHSTVEAELRYWVMSEMAGVGVVYRILDRKQQMPTPQREPLRRLHSTERAALQHIASSVSDRADYVRRATALLAVARTGVFSHAAREAGLRSGTTMPRGTDSAIR